MNDLIKTEKASVVVGLAEQLQCDPAKLLPTLKKTAFSTCRTDEELMAMCLVARQYGLNPFLKEIYAFPTRNGGVMPMVSVDGWLRIINDNPAFDGMDFEEGDGYCTCTIYRKDRSHAIKATEWLDECKRSTEPWKQFPRRMLRNKAISQCARIAFGYSGIYDEDECQRTNDCIAIKPEPRKDNESFLDLSFNDADSAFKPSKNALEEALSIGGYTYSREDIEAFCARNNEVYDELSIVSNLADFIAKMDAEKTEVANG